MLVISLDQKVTVSYFDDGHGEWHHESTTVEDLLCESIDEDVYTISFRIDDKEMEDTNEKEF